MSIRFFEKAREVLDAQTGKSEGGACKLVRASEIGIMSAPGSPRHVTEPRICRMPTTSPAGIAAWEKDSLALQAHLTATSIDLRKPEKPKADKSRKPFSIPLST